MFADGLEGIVVAKTEMSDVDGERGRLTLRGYDVETIAGAVRFEAACALFWQGAIATPVDLGAARVAAVERLSSLGGALRLEDGMDALRASLAQLPAGADAALVAAATAVYAAAWYRTRRGLAPIPPDAKLSHSEDYLRMILGERPSDALARGLDAYLVAVSDHGMNASTFTARVIASTGSDLVSSIVGAVGALKGPLHGGAPGPVLDMLDAIGDPSQAEAWIAAEMEAGRRIMGMGHRIYRVRDPRAAVLESAVEHLEKSGVRSERLRLARAVEKVAEGKLATKYPNRSLRANVEFYTAVLLDTIGMPRELFSPTFAVGRVAGWCAHVEEQRKNGRLIRPASEYVGEYQKVPGTF